MDKDLIKKSFWEVFWLTIIAFFPLLINVIFQSVKLDGLKVAAIKIIHPSELLAFCLSFLAPSLAFIKKTHGGSYKLPFLDLFFYSTIFMYIIALLFVFIIKNNVDEDIISNLNEKKFYLLLTTIFLLVTIFFRIYSTYHTSKSSDFFKTKKEDEEDFVKSFKKSVHGK
ncbi:hypothetical protein [uncultured Chryseobacterium sp.]|uniref:hypothetical protein n=1 Tax=uncultured Chryseobacterium sp. TaxID=259322 RepID=UPI00258F7377|nr:hypothetical protein [uncultured Chryseobacterium sp.]